MAAAPNGSKGVRQASGKTAINRPAVGTIIMMLPVSVKDQLNGSLIGSLFVPFRAQQ